MKNLNHLLLAAAAAAAFTLAGNASGQINPKTDDGIAASPKVRQMLTERAASRWLAGSHSATKARGETTDRRGIAASPKVHHALAERKTAPRPVTPATSERHQ